MGQGEKKPPGGLSGPASRGHWLSHPPHPTPHRGQGLAKGISGAAGCAPTGACEWRDVRPWLTEATAQMPQPGPGQPSQSGSAAVQYLPLQGSGARWAVGPCEQHTLAASVSPVGAPNERAILKQLRGAKEPMVTMITRTTLIMIPTILILSPWGWGIRGCTQEAVRPADRGRVAGDAAVGACRAREGGCGWKPAIHLCSVQLVALQGGKDRSEGSPQGTAPHLPRATHIAYHALMLVQAAKPAAAPHRAAAACREGQGG